MPHLTLKGTLWTLQS